MRRVARELAVWSVCLGMGIVCLWCFTDHKPFPLKGPQDMLQRAEKHMKDGNFREAYQVLRSVATADDASPQDIRKALPRLHRCLLELGELWRLDEDLPEVLDRHPNDPDVLQAAAEVLLATVHFGTVLDEQFFRGYSVRGGPSGIAVNVSEQDRQRALRWLELAMNLITDDHPSEAQTETTARIYETLVDALLIGRQGQMSWRLQALTDLSDEPNYLDVDQQQSFPTSYAPVDAEGQPVLHTVPESWSAAASDGQRLRWVIAQAIAAGGETGQKLKLRWAEFVQSQFGVETLAEFHIRPMHLPDETERRDGILGLHTLQDNETIARLADGVHRFELPGDYNHVQLYKEIARAGRAEEARSAYWRLIHVYLNRRQYPKAVEQLEEFLERYPKAQEATVARELLDDIRLPRGTFDPMPPALAGAPFELSLLFRNASSAELVIRPVDFETLLSDYKRVVRGDESWPQLLGWSSENIRFLDLTLPAELFGKLKLKKYLLNPVVQREIELEPRPNHWDRRTRIEQTIERPGLYLVDATLRSKGGQRNTQTVRMLIWVQDIVLVRTPLDKQHLFQVLDARSGRPLSGINVELFGWKYENARGRQVVTRNMARTTDHDGAVRIALDDEFRWVAVARSQDGGIAVLPAAYIVSRGLADDRLYRQTKCYGVTDRPLYRPGETVHGKLWLGRVGYGGAEAPALLSDVDLTVTVVNPRGEKLLAKQVTTDRWGSVDLEFELPDDALLGNYKVLVSLAADQTGSGMPAPHDENRTAVRLLPINLQFRVEEYRKPEFEIDIHAPERPVMLGETVPVRIEAKYFMGAPVAEGQAHVRVTREVESEPWFPPRPFDWLYGRGYWWLGKDRGDVHSSRSGVGGLCDILRIPFPDKGPAEVVMEQVVQLDGNGEATIEIDTADAKRLFGDLYDHRYEISVDVRDASRRTISAAGSVIAARSPFQVRVWTDRGHYRVGDTAKIHVATHTADGKPLETSGRLEVLQMHYDVNGKVQQRVIESWDIKTNASGAATHLMETNIPGQFLIRARLRDATGREVEGDHIVVVRGAGPLQAGLQFDALELKPDKMEYQVGETVQLLVASEHANAVVFLFVKPRDGIYSPPTIVQLEGHTAVVPIEVKSADQPNFFVDAFVVFDGELHVLEREIFVPPASRQLSVDLISNKNAYEPGESASIEVMVRDANEKPVQGAVALSVYDRALESIAGDALPPDIREYFWKWKRSHNPTHSSSAANVGWPIDIEDQPRWKPLGIFGESLADDLDLLEGLAPRGRLSGGRRSSAVPDLRGMADGQAYSLAPNLARITAAAEMAPEARGIGAPDRPIHVRRKFADAAAWATLVTDANGRGKIELRMPDNLTSWAIRAWVAADGVRVGSAAQDVVTRKQLMVRLAAPQFLVEQDEVTISAIVHNESDQPRQVVVRLEIDGETSLQLKPDQTPEDSVSIPPHGQARLDWRCQALASGDVKLRSLAWSGDLDDAVETELPVLVRGTLRTESWAGTLRSDQSSTEIVLEVPQQRRVAESKLVVRMSPSLALAITDALPFLVSYPHECTEQTLNRFLPTLITRRTLLKLGIDLSRVGERRTNLNPQEPGDATTRRAQWQHGNDNPVFDESEVERMVQEGVDRLTELQNSDGGWSWFGGQHAPSSPHITALIVRGLLLARQNGAAVVPDVIRRGVEWLKGYQQLELKRLKNWQSRSRPYKELPGNLDALVFYVLVEAGQADADMQEILYQRRKGLNPYGLGLLALATHRLGNTEQRDMLLRNIRQYLVVDAQNETAYLRMPRAGWWYWHNNEIQAMAIYLQLLALTNPDDAAAPQLVKYLLNNRKHASRWDSTLDTAMVVEAMCAYLEATREGGGEIEAEVALDGKTLGTIHFSPTDLFLVDNTITVTGAALPHGRHVLTIQRTSGEGNLYWNVYSTHFTQEEEIHAAGLEVEIQRRYYLLLPRNDTVELVKQHGAVHYGRSAQWRRVPIDDPATVESGQLVEVELVVSGRNDYEYLVVEDPRPAGCTSVDQISGYRWNDGLFYYKEVRDKSANFYLSRLPHGQYVLRYRLRAENPGTFTSLPARIEGMYAPELQGNSNDFQCQVVEQP